MTTTSAKSLRKRLKETKTMGSRHRDYVEESSSGEPTPIFDYMNDELIFRAVDDVICDIDAQMTEMWLFLENQMKEIHDND